LWHTERQMNKDARETARTNKQNAKGPAAEAVKARFDAKVVVKEEKAGNKKANWESSAEHNKEMAETKLEHQNMNHAEKVADFAEKVEKVEHQAEITAEKQALKDKNIEDKNQAYLDHDQALVDRDDEQAVLRAEYYARVQAKIDAQQANAAEKAARNAQKMSWTLTKARSKLAYQLSKLSDTDGDVLSETGCVGNAINWVSSGENTIDGDNRIIAHGSIEVNFPAECKGLWYSIVNTRGEEVAMYESDSSVHIDSIAHYTGHKGYRILTDNNHWGLAADSESIALDIAFDDHDMQMADPSTFQFYYCCQGPQELHFAGASHCNSASNEYAQWTEDSSVESSFVMRKRKRRNADIGYTYGKVTLSLHENAESSAQYFIVKGNPFAPLADMWVKYDNGNGGTHDVTVTKVDTDTFQVDAGSHMSVSEFLVKFDGAENQGHFVSWYYCQTW